MGEWRQQQVEGRANKGVEATANRLYSFAALHPGALVAGGLFIASLTLYIGTLAPSVVTLFDDSLEFQLVTYQLGIAHPTGYPLYTLLGKLFTFLPTGDVAYRVNLMSAVFGAATVALLYLLILQVTTPEKGGRIAIRTPTWPVHLGGIIGALMLAVSRVFWQLATVAEVYTLNAFFMVTLLLLVTTLPRLTSLQKQKRQIWGAAFFTGLSLTHHRTIVLLYPALALYFYLNRKSIRANRKILISSVLLGLFPLLLYLYLPWRGHVGSLDGTYQNTWSGFWRQIGAAGYGLFIFENPFGQVRDAAFYWNLLEGQFYTVVPGFTGVFYLLWIGRGKALVLTGLAFLTYLSFNLVYRVSDIEVFFIPVFLLWAIWSGVGVTLLLNIASTLKYQHWPPILVTILLAIFAFIIFQRFGENYTSVAEEHTWQIHDYGLDVLQQPLPVGGRSAIVGILGEMTLLRYFQQTENRRPDIATIAADMEADRLAVVEKLISEGKSVYLTRELPGAAERWSLGAVGPLIQVNPKPAMELPQYSFSLGQAITPEITLMGYNLGRPAHTGSGPAPVRLTLFWQATAPLSADLKVSARLLNSVDEVLAMADAVPVHFAYPTTAWRPGEIISDVYDLVLPTGTPSGQYTPLLIWYDPAQNAAEVGRIELEPITLE